jgi:hypothetical protein
MDTWLVVAAGSLSGLLWGVMLVVVGLGTIYVGHDLLDRAVDRIRYGSPPHSQP